MTAQIYDTVAYHNQEYVLLSINGSHLFQPQLHGVTPATFSTACWRGYHCSYQVIDELLQLRKLHIGLDEADTTMAERGEGPCLFGVVPCRYEQRGWMVNSETGQLEEVRWSSPEFVYDPLSAAVSFNGGLIIALDFIHDLYMHMGFYPACSYKHVHELIFEAGRLVQATDCSTAVAEVRKHVGAQTLGPLTTRGRAELERSIGRCFSLKYEW